MPLPLLAALLFTAPPPPAELPSDAEVVVSGVGAYVAPDAASIAPERLRKGTRVRVLDSDEVSGWLTIEPPPAAFDWVDRSKLKPQDDHRARVVAERAVARTGIPKAKLPGPPRAVLDRGTVVTLLDRAPLVVKSGMDTTTWLAIAPLKGEVRYVRAEAVTHLLKTEKSNPTEPEPPRETRASFRPDSAPEPGSIGGLPAELAAEVARAESEHRAILAEPIDRWRFERVKARYEAILKQVTDPGASAAIQQRLDQVANHEAVARAGRSFQTILERSRRRDVEVAMVERQLAEIDRPQRKPFVAEGLVQPSSRQVDGRKVFALIGPEGSPVAYLDIPDGLDARPAVAKRVGVRGSVRYNESLGLRLIAVRDLETIE